MFWGFALRSQTAFPCGLLMQQGDPRETRKNAFTFDFLGRETAALCVVWNFDFSLSSAMFLAGETTSQVGPFASKKMSYIKALCGLAALHRGHHIEACFRDRNEAPAHRPDRTGLTVLVVLRGAVAVGCTERRWRLWPRTMSTSVGTGAERYSTLNGARPDTRWKRASSACGREAVPDSDRMRGHVWTNDALQRDQRAGHAVLSGASGQGFRCAAVQRCARYKHRSVSRRW